MAMSSSRIYAWTFVVPAYVKDLPNAVSDISNPVLYTDGISLVITNSDTQMLEKDINTAILQKSK
jgi:hypothetical protein